VSHSDQTPPLSPSERELETLEQPRPDPPSVSVFTLEVVEGPDRGRTFTIEPSAPGPTLLGQSRACAICLTDRSVSRRHLSLEVTGPRLRLRDLDSTNGTLVNDVVAAEASLRGGEVVHVGGTVLRADRRVARLVTPPPRESFGRMLGRSPAMQRIYAACDALLAASAPLVIEGEPGTGKELLAEVLHERGPRARGPFAVIDASADASGLAGGALAVFDSAAGGTLIIREVCDLDERSQHELARWLDERQKTSSAATALAGHFDVRLIVTSSRDLDHEAQEGRFSQELAEQLGAARIELPPLRKREGDVAVLAKHFWAVFGGAPAALTTEMIRRLDARSWPNNVRDLRLGIARMIAAREETHAGDGKSFDDLVSADLPFPRARELVLERFERLYVERMLARHLGNVSRAAEAAGIARRYFQIVKSRYKKEPV